ncbi:MAG: hypothetical protein ABSH15_04330 [Verrucomicrobiota bacterium]|jgi:hypothetical protein
MNAPKKLRGGTGSELTRFKLMWRDSMSESARDFWRALFASDTTQADIRRQLAVKLQIKFTRDDQLTSFRDWEFQQRLMDLEAERMKDDERRLQEEFGEQWTLDQIREEVLKRSYARALATGDFASGRKTIVQDLNVKKVSLDERKVTLLEKKAAAFDQIKNAAKSKGGLTRETIAKIERELNLL